MNNIVNTPVRLELAENRIGLDESNLLTSLMENNTYDVKIHTNEILDGCKLVMKRYGDKTREDDNDLIIIDTFLDYISCLFGTEKLLNCGLLAFKLLIDRKEVHHFVENVGRKVIY